VIDGAGGGGQGVGQTGGGGIVDFGEAAGGGFDGRGQRLVSGVLVLVLVADDAADVFGAELVAKASFLLLFGRLLPHGLGGGGGIVGAYQAVPVLGLVVGCGRDGLAVAADGAVAVASGGLFFRKGDGGRPAPDVVGGDVQVVDRSLGGDLRRGEGRAGGRGRGHGGFEVALGVLASVAEVWRGGEGRGFPHVGQVGRHVLGGRADLVDGRGAGILVGDKGPKGGPFADIQGRRGVVGRRVTVSVLVRVETRARALTRAGIGSVGGGGRDGRAGWPCSHVVEGRLHIPRCCVLSRRVLSWRLGRHGCLLNVDGGR